MEYADRATIVRETVDIVHAIGAVLTLTQAGATYKGLCPFHGENTPSFHVNRDKGFFHCFGCGASGDIVKFIERTRHVDFTEAVEIAERELVAQ